MLKIDFDAMGCEMAVFLDNETPEAARQLDQVPGWFETWEQSLSRFRADSELNRINAVSGLGMEVSSTMRSALAAALAAARWSDGLVVPNILKSLERAGYDRTFEALPTPCNDRLFSFPVTGWDLDNEDAANAWRAIQLDEQRSMVHIPDGMKLDLGGSAKGWAADQAMRRLEKWGPVLVDAGGDIAISGPTVNGNLWVVGVSDPLRMQEELAQLSLPRCGVATSGIDYRRWMKDGQWKHHIIDPRTGAPAVTDLISVTVVAPDVLMAETAAKVAMILGSFAGQAWIEKDPALAALLVLQDGRVLRAGRREDYLQE